MPAPRFFVDEIGEGLITLSPRDSRHALRSLRLRPGDEITLADGRGGVARGRLEAERAGEAMVKVAETGRVRRGYPQVSIALAPPSGERLAWAVQKLGELGVDGLVLIESTRSIRKWKRGRVEQALARLRSIAREAAMQSRQPFVMQVEGPVPLADALADARATILLSERTDRRLSEVLPERPAAVRLVVGPEGGLSDEEVERAIQSGAPVASLGSTILRSETAAVVGAALALARYGRLG